MSADTITVTMPAASAVALVDGWYGAGNGFVGRPDLAIAAIENVLNGKTGEGQ